MADFYCPLDEFEFEYKGRWVSCVPAGGAIALVGGQARPSKPIWDIRVDGVRVGQFDAEMNETLESVRDAAVKLAEEFGGRVRAWPTRETRF